MKITLLCSDTKHPVNSYLEAWIIRNSNSHDISIVRRKSELTDGDFLFLISCSEIVNANDRSLYKYTLVLHASDLPHGRGWSPHIWGIIEGANHLTLSLLEAEDKVDTGKIWKKRIIPVPKHLIWSEINHLLFLAEIELIEFAIDNYLIIEPEKQDLKTEPSYYRKRTSLDSKLNPEQSIVSQFDLLRICDPERYPAILELYGHKYKLILEKVDD